MKLRLHLLPALCLILLSAFLPLAQASARETLTFDVAVIGAGSGGTSAAIQAARMGMKVALVEKSDWVGGQMTGAAVSSMDDKMLTRTGIYLEFITRVREHYAKIGRNVNVCYWHDDTISFEPSVGRAILLEMIKEAKNITLFLKTRALSAELEKDRVVSAKMDSEGEKFDLRAAIFIDATECGDFIPLTGARYRAGNSVFPKGSTDGIIQDITYPAVVKRYPNGVPEELIMTTPPPDYEKHVLAFRKVITISGDMWPGNYPFNVPTHNSYRAMPDPDNDSIIMGGQPITWHLITKTAINWANDYPDGKNGVPGMSVAFLEDETFRQLSSRSAMMKTLSFIYYMQTELEMTDWSVDNGQGYGTWFDNNWREQGDIPAEFAPILSHFPPFPYVRESRRIIGVKTMTVNDLTRDQKLKRALKNVPHSVALGEYPIDIHGVNEARWLELDLGETPEKIPNDWEGWGGLFQIPFEVFIPEKVNGLLAAEKNISVSRAVNGSIRLQPVTMLTGQAAGAIAALSVKKKVQPRSLHPVMIQNELLKAKSRLALLTFADVPDYAAVWPAVELATLYGYITPADDKNFGLYEQVSWEEVSEAVKKALGVISVPRRDPLTTPSQEEFAAFLGEVLAGEKNAAEAGAVKLIGDKVLTKGKLAQALYDVIIASEGKLLNRVFR